MENFIMGVLVENEDGATYRGKVYDRFLKLQLVNGKVLSIFDPAEPISVDLSVGSFYSMVLITLPLSEPISYTQEIMSDLDESAIQGRVVNIEWKGSKENYKYAHPEAYTQSWILLETQFGRLLMSQNHRRVLKVGDNIQWKSIRFDLCAVA